MTDPGGPSEPSLPSHSPPPKISTSPSQRERRHRKKVVADRRGTCEKSPTLHYDEIRIRAPSFPSYEPSSLSNAISIPSEAASSATGQMDRNPAEADHRTAPEFYPAAKYALFDPPRAYTPVHPISHLDDARKLYCLLLNQRRTPPRQHGFPCAF